jgi:hypothetical protein
MNNSDEFIILRDPFDNSEILIPRKKDENPTLNFKYSDSSSNVTPTETIVNSPVKDDSNIIRNLPKGLNVIMERTNTIAHSFTENMAKSVLPADYRTPTKQTFIPIPSANIVSSIYFQGLFTSLYRRRFRIK